METQLFVYLVATMAIVMALLASGHPRPWRLSLQPVRATYLHAVRVLANNARSKQNAERAAWMDAKYRRRLEVRARRFFTMATEGSLARFEHIENSVLITVCEPIIEKDEEGKKAFLGNLKMVREYTLRNTVLPVFYPKECAKYPKPVLVIQWGEKVTQQDLETRLHILEDKEGLQVSKELREQGYDGGWFAGSQAKSRKTYAFPVGWKPGRQFFTYAEASVKLARALVPAGRTAFRGNLRVKTIANGVRVGNLLIEDGFMYIAEDIVKPHLGDLAPIVLGQSHQNAQVWQMLPWSSVQDDIRKANDTYYADMKTSGVSLTTKMFGETEGVRKRFLEAYPKMDAHPLFILRWSDAVYEWFLERATTPPIESVGALAVPASCYTMEVGNWGIVRWPVASYFGINAVTVGADDEEAKRERARIAKSGGAVQLTITTDRDHIKGVAMIVPRSELPAGIDLLTSNDNFKLGRNTSVGPDEFIDMKAAVTVVTAYYGAETLVGVPYKTTKAADGTLTVGWGDKAGDYDGDYLFIMRLDEYPNIMRAIRELPVLPNVKGTKTHLSTEIVAEFLLNVMGAHLGWWTNLRGATFNVNPEYRNALAQIYFDQNMSDAPTELAMDMVTTKKVQDEVDSFKSMKIKTQRTWRQAMNIQRQQFDLIGRVPHQIWGGFESKWAFRKGMPKFYSQLPKEYIDRTKLEPGFIDSQEWRSMIDDRIYGGTTIYENYHYVQDVLMGLFRFGRPDPRPLSDYYNLVPEVSVEEINKATSFLKEWDHYVKNVIRPMTTATSDDRQAYGASVVEDTVYWMAEWSDIAHQWAKKKFKEHDGMTAYQVGAAALWRACHESISMEATGGAAIYGFTEELLTFLKGGQVCQDCKTMVVGAKYHFSHIPFHVEGVEVNVVKSEGRTLLVVKAPLNENQIWNDKRTPDGTIGMVANLEKKWIRQGFVVPFEGKYVAKMEYDIKLSAWVVELVAVK